MARSRSAKPKASAGEQLPLFRPHGGARRGAGRPRASGRRSEAHKERPFHHGRHPVHVVVRVVDAIGNLRRRDTYLAIQHATVTAARREVFRIVHLSVQRTHLHLIVEAETKAALAAGMQGFEISAAKQLNAAISRRRPGPRRRGQVFADRYHATVITSPRQTRHVLGYVMGNWRKHEEDRNPKLHGWTIDWFSSAIAFPDWAEYGDAPFLWRWPEGYAPLIVFRPRTWLLRVGWKKSSPTISYREVPSSR